MISAQYLSGPFCDGRRGRRFCSLAAPSPSEGRREGAVCAAKRVFAASVAVAVLCAFAAAGALASSGTIATRWAGFAWGGTPATSSFLNSGVLVRAEREGVAHVARKRKPKPISAASAFILPSASQCVIGRKLTIQLRAPRGVTWIGANVYVNGRHFKTVKRSQITKPVRLTGLPRQVRPLDVRQDERRAQREGDSDLPDVRNGPTAVPAPIDAGLGGGWFGERVGQRYRLSGHVFAQLFGWDDGHLDRFARVRLELWRLVGRRLQRHGDVHGDDER